MNIRLSPTPWTFAIEGDDYVIYDARGKLVMTDTEFYPIAPSRDDAALIVMAMNTSPLLREEHKP